VCSFTTLFTIVFTIKGIPSPSLVLPLPKGGGGDSGNPLLSPPPPKGRGRKQQKPPP